MIETVTEGSRRIARARARYDKAYADLVAAIREETGTRAVSVAEASRQSGWSREYIGQIRAGAAGSNTPKHRNPVTREHHRQLALPSGSLS